MKGKILLGIFCLALTGMIWPTLNHTSVAKADMFMLSAQVVTGTHSVSLKWIAPVVDSTHVAAAGYNVKRGTVTGGPYTTIASPTAITYTDSTVTGGAKYFYVVTAVCPTCSESAPSNEVAVTVPLDQINPVTGLVVAATN